jgi:hypothetical protein
LEDDEDVLDKMVYTLTNPTAAGLVKRGNKWPGFRTDPAHCAGHRQTVTRPTVYFAEDGVAPPQLELNTCRPDIFPELSDEQFAALLAQKVEEREAEIRAEMAAEGRRFLGPNGVLRQKITSSPNTQEPRRQLSPRVAAKNKWRRIEALRRIKQFQQDYRKAFESFKAHIRDVVFPAGTYAMLHLHQVAVAGSS